jgi:8-oxo-dGTP pyrophosphatase MutT (NUDIX family)
LQIPPGSQNIVSKMVEVIQRAFEHPLPGWAGQQLMEPELLPDLYPDRLRPLINGGSLRQAGVMIMLYPAEGELYCPLTRRKENLPDHGGQISLPGGSLENNEIPLQAALRETEEEIGIPADRLKLLGALSPLYIPVSRFFLHPFVTFFPDTPPFKVQEDEVAELLLIPLAMLRDRQNHRSTTWPESRLPHLRHIPYFAVNGSMVWGATAMILSEFINLLEQAEEDS